MEAKILNKARQLYFSYGIKSITMEDISKGLGISKKTIYNYFDDKNAIIERVVDDFLQDTAQKMQEVTDRAEDVIQEEYALVSNINDQVQCIQMAFFYELEKSYPQLMQKMNAYKHNILINKIENNVTRGMELGIYRPELIPSEVALIRLSLIEDAFTNTTFLSAGWQTRDILITLTNFYLHSITSYSGKELINKYIYKAE